MRTDPLALAWRAAWIATSALCTDLCARQLCGLTEADDCWHIHNMVLDAREVSAGDPRAGALIELASGASNARFGLDEMPPWVLSSLHRDAERLASLIHRLQAPTDPLAWFDTLNLARAALTRLFQRMLDAVEAPTRHATAA